MQKKTKFILNNKINLQSFIYYKNNRFIYELIGIVTNIMNSESKKHFIAFCKSYEDYYWYKYDNNSIAIPSSFEEAKKLGEYDILFYSKIWCKKNINNLSNFSYY